MGVWVCLQVTDIPGMTQQCMFDSRCKGCPFCGSEEYQPCADYCTNTTDGAGNPVSWNHKCANWENCRGCTQCPTFGIGDPHVLNLKGESFDIRRVGMKKLIEIQDHDGVLLLRVDGYIGQGSVRCRTWITNLTVHGRWVESLDGGLTPQLDFTIPDINLKEMLVNGQKPQDAVSRFPLPKGFIPRFTIRSAATGAGTKVRLDLDGVKLDIYPASEPRETTTFLNLQINGLHALNNSVKMGGLLGYDDHRLDSMCMSARSRSAPDTHMLSWLGAE